MARNLEVKARLASPVAAARVARRLGAVKTAPLYQTDTYFSVADGRLKLREIRGHRSVLIFYRRPDERGTGGRWSVYTVVPVEHERNILRRLSLMYGVRVRVKKSRILFQLENARIHIDRVKGLGAFLEFEVIEEKGRAQANRLYQRLVKAFGIHEEETIAGSYADIMESALASNGLKSYIG
ncbi:MAG: hypothetical protein A2X67_12390 [Ignavibacteria bacterium GWA2_55_11]|nr:MAG: hypothetical protein A2X67_12390 [Ignavibacteria bacterium GWA2_55_11]OGU62447.1 MAG: hypothetical protein A3C56_05695 [Ignavibacteria bacterium RIFCSPHIGHO2_02_FULL_56_12]OGU73883.1 MAG: hypothetical protein A3G43_00855 [Ignavibacteria bacterium RIFCSPLOWO2_12_FULL_56_21]OGU75601.1 MAG: hypothetical protein A3H45_11535 [Ignavibacteria bacterium RIFCSPLOWO2_02_FULL_55_14]